MCRECLGTPSISFSMVFTLEFINTKFSEFNLLIFGGTLPKIPVKLSKSKSALGMFKRKYKAMPDGSQKTVSHYFSFSTHFDLEPALLEDVIIHEMIHYYIFHHKLKDTSPHGRIFRNLMHQINTRHGRNVTISTKTQPEERTGSVNSAKKWHIIAALRMKDGSVGLKVLPRIAQRAIYYRDMALRSKEITAVELFFHNSPFFNDYPSSAALKIYPIKEDKLSQELAGAQRIIISGTRLSLGEKFNGDNIFH